MVSIRVELDAWCCVQPERATAPVLPHAQLARKLPVTALPKLNPVVIKPRLSDRAAAKFIRLPAVEQMRILREQKFPKNAPQVFKTPYYQHGRSAIRELIERGEAGLANARAIVQAIGNPSRRMHSMRVLEQFWASEHASRGLKLVTWKRYLFELGDVELRTSPDLLALQGDDLRFIYFNLNAEEQDPEVARMTLELAHWIMKENDVDVRPEQLEFIDLFTGTLYRGKKPRQRTIELMQENAKLIESFWPSIDP